MNTLLSILIISQILLNPADEKDSYRRQYLARGDDEPPAREVKRLAIDGTYDDAHPKASPALHLDPFVRCVRGYRSVPGG